MLRGDPSRVEPTLERARSLGFLGPGPLAVHLGQAAAMAAAIDAPDRFLDLGSGGGVPGLPLLYHWVEARGVLLDARRRCASFLREALGSLGLDDRASVQEGRAEALARDQDLRGAFGAVVARGFGPPAVTAECAVGFLRVGGTLLVSEPPEPDPQRWPSTGVEALGLEALGATRHEGFGVARFRLAAPVPERWPRRMPAKRPLWT